MHNRKDNARRRSGSVLLITLMVMLAITILGIASINSTIVELKVSRNEREARKNFYLAEGAAMEGIQRLIDVQSIDLNEQFAFWHHPKNAAAGGRFDFRDRAQWQTGGSSRDNAMQSPLHPETFIAAVEWKVATGGSLVQTGTRLYQNRVYGLCTRDGSDNLVEIGYYLRY